MSEPTDSNSQSRVRPELGSVQETLLIPVYARAVESQRSDRLFHDPRSMEMVETIDYDFDRFREAGNVIKDVTIRTSLLDRLVGDFIQRYPAGQVVNLGAGLDTRFSRLDNGEVHWVDLDMPDSIALRELFFDTGPRNRMIARSMFDWDWFDDLFEVPPQQTLLIAEGLFMYFEAPAIRQLLTQVADRLPGCQLLFQSISPRYVGRQRSVRGVNATTATFGWGIGSGRELESWDPRIRFCDEWHLVDLHPHRWGKLRWLAKLPVVGREVRQVMKFSQVRFESNS